MRIALIAPTSIPARTANSIQVMKMAQALASLGHFVYLVAPGTSPGAPWEYLAPHYGLPTDQPETLEIGWLPRSKFWRGYDYARKAVQRAKDWNADLIYTRLPQAAALASSQHLTTIFEIHDLPTGRMGPFLFRRFLSGKGARRLVAITQALADDLAGQFDAPREAPFTLIAPDGVDLERFADLPAPAQARRDLKLADRFTAGYTGHLYPGRGVELLLDVAAQLPEVRFLLVGGEPADVQRVQAQVEDAKMRNLTLTGFIRNAELPRYQAACDLLLMPYQARVSASSGGDISRYLSPMKLFEYLACGRAILSSDLPVLQEVLNADNAMILPAADASAWAQAIQQLQAEPVTREKIALNARQTAQKHSWKARAEHILDSL
ncbi:MAG: glycosyltransferase [Anaerolineales bacterium]|nr:glycosyltransferase [Anaerolineales bacterium]